MQAKYGNPTAQFFGAKLDGTVTQWSNAVSAILLFERTAGVDSCFVLVTHKELAKLARARIEAERKAHLKDDL